MKIGGLNHLITNPRDMPGFVKELGVPLHCHHRRQHAVQWPAQHAGIRQARFLALHLSLGGGMAVQRAVAERWKQVTGVTLVEAYGLTETSPAACINPLDMPAVQRLHRPADSVDRSRHPGRRRQANWAWAKSANCACAARR
jgi:long-chain acyl-CoA synthetase